MPDEIGTEISRSEARSAEEVLFGDDADDAAAEAVDEEAPEAEAAQDLEDPDDAGGQAVPQEELKVVLSIKGGRATIGVQQPSSDPHIESFDDLDLAGLTQEVQAVIARARPAPPARRRPRREQAPAQASAAEGGTEQQ